MPIRAPTSTRFGKAFAVVRADYVEPPTDEQMVEGAIGGMLGNLDPHSSYFDPRTYAAMQVKTEGQYGGVGLVIGLDESLVTDRLADRGHARLAAPASRRAITSCPSTAS